MAKNNINEASVQSLYGLAEKQYSILESRRSTLEPTWEDCARLTLPYLSQDVLDNETSLLPTPYNSIGPSAVNTLSSKLLLSLLPFTNTFFRLLPFEEDVKDLAEDVILKIDQELTMTERQIITMIDTQTLRVPLNEALKYLIVMGNALLYKVPNGTFKVFSPYQFVVERDYVGNVLKIVIKEKMSLTSLPQEVRDIYKEKDIKDNEDIEIYTVICKTDEKNFVSYQETNEVVISGTLSTHKKDFMPYIPLRWTSVVNEDYGRGLAEQYLGDLRSLEALSQLILEGADVMTKTVFGVKPGTMTSLDELNKARNGDFVTGDLENDITTLRVDKNSDFSIPFQLMQSLEQRLSRAFLILGGNIRDSERTTATEVRAVTAELEAALGGTYSVLAAELQLPLIKILLREISPKYTEITQPSIITGVSAISREKDYANLNTMLQSVAKLGPEAIQTYLNVPGYLTAIANSLGMNPDEMINTPEQIQAKQQAMQAAQQPQQPTGPQGL